MSVIYDLKASCALRSKENVELRIQMKEKKHKKPRQKVNDARETYAMVKVFGDDGDVSDNGEEVWSLGMGASSSEFGSESSDSVGTSVSRR